MLRIFYLRPRPEFFVSRGEAECQEKVEGARTTMRARRGLLPPREQSDFALHAASTARKNLCCQRGQKNGLLHREWQKRFAVRQRHEDLVKGPRRTCKLGMWPKRNTQNEISFILSSRYLFSLSFKGPRWKTRETEREKLTECGSS